MLTELSDVKTCKCQHQANVTETIGITFQNVFGSFELFF